MRSGIEPGEAAAQNLDKEIAALQIDALTSVISSSPRAEGFERGGNVDDVVVVKIEAGDGDVRFRMSSAFPRSRRARPDASSSTTPYCPAMLTI